MFLDIGTRTQVFLDRKNDGHLMFHRRVDHDMKTPLNVTTSKQAEGNFRQCIQHSIDHDSFGRLMHSYTEGTAKAWLCYYRFTRIALTFKPGFCHVEYAFICFMLSSGSQSLASSAFTISKFQIRRARTRRISNHERLDENH